MNLNKKDMKNLMLRSCLPWLSTWEYRRQMCCWFPAFSDRDRLSFPFGSCLCLCTECSHELYGKKLFGSAESKGKMKKLGRPLSLILSLILVVGIVLVVILVVVPEMGQTFMSVSASIEAAIPRLQTWAVDTFHDNKQIAEWIQNLEFDWNSIIGAAVDFLKNGAGNVLNSTVAMARTVVNVLMNFLSLLCLPFIFFCRRRS